MQTIVLETFLAFGLCLAAVIILAITDSYHDLQLSRQRRQLAAPMRTRRSPITLLPSRSVRRPCPFDGLFGH